MNGLAIVEKGTEQVMADELHTLFNATKVAVLQTAVSFNVDKIEDLIRIIYKTRTAKKILLEFGKFNADNKLDSTLKKIKKLVEKTAFKKWITSVDSFRVRCLRKGKHNFVRNDIEREVGALIIEVLGKKQCPKVIMRNSDLTVFIYIIENKGWFGIDMTGKDLSKRDYRVFNYPRSLKGNIAYTALKLGGYKPGELLVDPFSGSGTIPIEAALWCTNKAPNFRIEEFAFINIKSIKDAAEKVIIEENKKIIIPDKKIYAIDFLLNNINTTRKNSKIAGVHEYLEITKKEVDWMDTIFNKNSVDKVVSQPPPFSKKCRKKDVEKLYQELFVQVKNVMKPKGRIVLVVSKDEEILGLAKKHKFILDKDHEIYTGEQKLKVLVFKKQKNI